jgi:hypothetical protein
VTSAEVNDPQSDSQGLRDGNIVRQTGEIPINNHALTGTGNQRTVTADLVGFATHGRFL